MCPILQASHLKISEVINEQRFALIIQIRWLYSKENPDNSIKNDFFLDLVISDVEAHL